MLQRHAVCDCRTHASRSCKPPTRGQRSVFLHVGGFAALYTPRHAEDELDSYMFQTVGHEAIELVAQAMGLPLYRSTTSGRSKGRGLQYQEEEGDEVEDLYHLLQRVQRSEEVEGVASGAVLSDYQRLRVENV